MFTAITALASIVALSTAIGLAVAPLLEGSGALDR